MVSTYGWICPLRSIPGTRAPPMRTLTVRIVSECFCKMNLATLRTRGVPCPCRAISILATLKSAYPRDKTISPTIKHANSNLRFLFCKTKRVPAWHLCMRFQLGKLFGNTVYSTEYPESPRVCLASISLSCRVCLRAWWLAWCQHSPTNYRQQKKTRRIRMRMKIGIMLSMGMNLRVAKRTKCIFIVRANNNLTR